MTDPGRKRRPDIVLITSAVALAAIILILCRVIPGTGGSAGRTPAATPAETTFRNVTNETIRYTVDLGQPSVSQEPRFLIPGAVDRFTAEKPFKVTYQSGDKTLLFLALPGSPYSFRYNEQGQVRLYPGSHGMADAVDLAPYVQTPMPVVEKMLELAALGPGDVLYDIGCGDGRIVITAAKKYGIRAVGIDILPRMVEASRANARREGVEKLTRFISADATKANLSEATVVTLYLLPESNELLRPKLERELRPGARVVSHGYIMTGWENRLTGKATVVDEKGEEHSVFAYRKPLS
jgi:SAM-dependent methyltransferase